MKNNNEIQYTSDFQEYLESSGSLIYVSPKQSSTAKPKIQNESRENNRKSRALKKYPPRDNDFVSNMAFFLNNCK